MQLHKLVPEDFTAQERPLINGYALGRIRQPNGKKVTTARFEHSLLALLKPCQTTITIMSLCGSVQLRSFRD